jgi:hypothetical protein
MIFTWSSLKGGERIFLSILGEMSRDEPVTVEPAAICAYPEEQGIDLTLQEAAANEAAERLFGQDLLFKDARGEQYSFKMDLWRHWTQRMHSIWQVIDEVKELPVAEREGVDLKEGRKRRMTLVGAAAGILVGAAFMTYKMLTPDPAPVIPEGAVVVAPVDSTSLSVASMPGGADVFLDGQWIGRTPLDRTRVEARRASVRIQLSGYHTVRDSLDLRRDEPESLFVALADRTGGLRVVSSPSGARILLDGEDTGQRTPFTFDGLTVNDRHSVRLAKAGFVTASETGLEIAADSTLVVFRDLAEVTHPLTIVSEPTGAEVLIDGVLRGTAPLNLNGLTLGEHTVEIRLDGHHVLHRTVTVPVDDNMVRYALETLPPGTLVIQVQPYAEIWLDGERLDVDAVYHRLNRPQGSYDLELRHPAYPPHRVRVDLRAGETDTVRHRFTSREGSP